MSTHTVPIEDALTPEQSLLADQIGNEVYASHYAERKLSRFIIGAETVFLCGCMWTDLLSVPPTRSPIVTFASTRWAEPRPSSTPT